MPNGGRKRRAMIFSESITFDDEEIGRASVSHASGVTRTSDDPEFLDRLRSGDCAAFDMLIDRYSGDIYAMLYRITQSAEEADDLTQDTFMRVLRSIKNFRGDAELRTWLFRIAINESRNRFRWWKRRSRDKTLSIDASVGDSDTQLWETIADKSASPEDITLTRERSQRVGQAIAGLKDVYREAVTLCDIEGLSYEECAVALETNVGTVKSRISRGRDELRKVLRDL